VAIFRFGQIIRKRREDLGLTQEDLADGICSVPTLSRIENGERLPTKNHFEMLVQRLGYSGTNIDTYITEQDFRIHELQFQIRQAYIESRYDEARILLTQYEMLAEEGSCITRQFCLLLNTLLYAHRYTLPEQLARLEEAIMLTCPKYNARKIPHVLSYEEILLINGIANCHALSGNRRTAIEMLLQLKEYYQQRMINTEEALRTQPLILLNLSNMLGQEGRYDECIEICNIAIRIARTTGRCPLLARTLYNKAWALVKRHAEGDLAAARHTAVQAFYMASIMKQEQSAQHYQRFIQENFGETISL